MPPRGDRIHTCPYRHRASNALVHNSHKTRQDTQSVRNPEVLKRNAWTRQRPLSLKGPELAEPLQPPEEEHNNDMASIHARA
eukprot:14768431-Alexandrium_andersonii.AAC.1